MTALTPEKIQADRQRMHALLSNKTYDGMPLYDLAKMAGVPRERFNAYAHEAFPDRPLATMAKRVNKTEHHIVSDEKRQRITAAITDPANADKTIVELRKLLHCQRMDIRRVARDLGIRLREGKFPLGVTTHTQNNIERIKQLRDEGNNPQQIAKSVGMTLSSLSNYCLQAGIKLTTERGTGVIKIDHVAVLKQTVDEIVGIAASLKMVPIHLGNIDRATADEYGALLRPALREISSLSNKLRRKADVSETPI